MSNQKDDTVAHPFLKWAGGKSQLLAEIKKHYPFTDSEITKYAEPFVGGGAVLFDILNKYTLRGVYISDINAELINAYNTVKNFPDELIEVLDEYQNKYLVLNEANRRETYYSKRYRFNELKSGTNNEHNIEKAALMIFLNKTCFNGLYRVNKKGQFNVPMGAYKHPTICDAANLRAVSLKLQDVNIVCGDYRKSADFVDAKTFVYFDPPYRPLTGTSNFTAYTEFMFNDIQQTELANFVKLMNDKGAKIVVSNSDPRNSDGNDSFFENIYVANKIRRVEATRMINCVSASRGKISELLISNF